MKLRSIVFAALGGAISFVLMRLTAFPLFPSAPFLKIEFSEVPLLLIAALVSPLSALAAQLVKDCLILFGGANFFGALSDFLAGGTFVVLFGMLVAKANTLPRAAACGAVALMARLALAVPLNLIILWFEFGTHPAQVMAMMPVLLPFNAIKSLLGAVCFALLYPRLRRALPYLGFCRADGAAKVKQMKGSADQ